MSKIKKSIKEVAEKAIFIASPKSYLYNPGDLKDLLTGKQITVDDLLKENTKVLLVSLYISQVKMNGKIRFHDWFIKGLITVVILGSISYFIFR